MSKNDNDAWLVQQIYKYVMSLDRIKNLIAAGHTDKHKIKNEVEYHTEIHRKGGDMRAVSVMSRVDKAVRAKYKSIRLSSIAV